MIMLILRDYSNGGEDAIIGIGRQTHLNIALEVDITPF